MRKGDLIFRVTANGYVPVGEDAVAQHRKLKAGDLVAGNLHRSRSLPQNRLYWGILRHVAAATKFETKEKLHVALKMRLGYFEMYEMPNGKVVPVVDSMSFSSAGQDEFAPYFDRAVRLICEEVLGGMDSGDLIAEVQALLGMEDAGAAAAAVKEDAA